MPNYNLMVTAGYKPYTFDEMVKPLMLYKQEYDKYQANLEDMQAKSDLAKFYIDEKMDAEALAAHRNYMQSMDEISAALSTQGLTAETATRARDLRRRFSSEISPILKAASERDQEIKEQRQALLHNPSLVFSRDAQNTPLSFYSKGTRDAYSVLNLKELEEQAKKAAANITAAYPQRVEMDYAYDNYGNPVAGYATERTYAGPRDSADVILNELNTVPYSEESYSGKYGDYAKLRKSLYDSINFSEYGNQGDKIKAAINAGLRSGITGKVSEKIVQYNPSNGKSSGKGKSGTSGDGDDEFISVETRPSPQGFVSDKSAKKIIENNKGLKELPMQAAAERNDLVGATDDEKEYNFTTDKLDEIAKRIQKHINDNEEEARKARIAAAAYHQSGRSFQMHVGGGRSNAINVFSNANNSDAVQEAHYRGVYEKYDNKLKELQDEYRKERDKVLNSEGFIRDKDNPFSFRDLQEYDENLKAGSQYSTIYESIPMTEGMQKDVLDDLAVLGDSSSSGLLPVENHRAGKPLSEKEKEKLMKELGTSKNIGSGIELVDGNYEDIVILNGKKYIIRGSGTRNFRDTFGKDISFLKKYSTQSKPIRVGNIKEWEQMIALNPNFPITDDNFKSRGLAINDANMEYIGTAGLPERYGIQLRDVDGNILNIVIDKNGYVQSWHKPKQDNINDTVHELASRYASVWHTKSAKSRGTGKDTFVTTDD